MKEILAYIILSLIVIWGLIKLYIAFLDHDYPEWRRKGAYKEIYITSVKHGCGRYNRY